MIVLLILLFCVIQSLFGVGLLLFGTPTLLLMGYSYEDTLVILLPPSTMISFIQTFLGFNLVDTKKLIFVYSIPMVVLGLILVLNFGEDFKLETIVGIMLLAIVFIRASKKTKNYINVFVNKYIKISFLMTGFIHGISNMGGGFLAIINGVHHSDKYKIRANIAFGYLFFAIIQLIIVFFLKEKSFNIDNLFYTFIALCTYFLSEKLFSKRLSNEKYQSMITLILFIYSLLCIF